MKACNLWQTHGNGMSMDDPHAGAVSPALQTTGAGKSGKHTRHRLKVADKAVDDAEECEDGGLVGGGDANMPGIARQFLCA